MERKYISPEVKVIRFEKTEDVIQTSGEQEATLKYTISGETMENYGTKNFSMFQ